MAICCLPPTPSHLPLMRRRTTRSGSWPCRRSSSPSTTTGHGRSPMRRRE
uniref:Uncharacterized protein n=1 Tax=Arundo donax TaxID=35708 RepID=A0A0A8YFN9_ARUDO